MCVAVWGMIGWGINILTVIFGIYAAKGDSIEEASADRASVKEAFVEEGFVKEGSIEETSLEEG